MALFAARDRSTVEAIRQLAFSNPFLPGRIALERQVLGPAFVPVAPVWSPDPRDLEQSANVGSIRRLVEELAAAARRTLREGHRPTAEEWAAYDELVLHVLYYRYEDVIYRELEARAPSGRASRAVPWYRDFAADAASFHDVPGSPAVDVAQLFALLHQVRRAFHFIFRRILGNSLAAARLRAAVWESIFTRDMRRYRRHLFPRMQDVSTLVVGPSGTGKELVALAIGLSRYIPFDARISAFVEDYQATFHPLNLAALAPSLIESELFGHRKGSFTGAIADREGHLHGRGPAHTVFLDEIGDVEAAVQVKLLRVLQDRVYQRVGDTDPQRFDGKIVTATNRDLARDVRAGGFREDLYYRLCADVIATPALAEQLGGDAAELRRLVLFLAARLVGEGEAARVADEVAGWIDRHLGLDYGWPGNMRELEQCVRSVVVHGGYQPLAAEGRAPAAELARCLAGSRLRADELVSLYCSVVHERTGSFSATGRELGLDRRTVAARVAAGRRAVSRGRAPEQ